MATYTIKSTDHTFSVTLETGTTNGDLVGSAGNSTDLLLYGQGSFNWGQGIEQNLLRIMENFACEAENPGANDLIQVPKIFGVLNQGITEPVVGQSWYNKSNDRLYRWNGTGWAIGDEGRYVKLSGGGTVDGILKVERPVGQIASFEVKSLGNADPVLINMSDSTGVKGRLFLDQDHDANPATNIDKFNIQKMTGALIVNSITLHDDHISTHGNNGKIRTPETLPSDDDETLTTKKYVDDANDLYVKIAGATMTGDLIINSGTPLLRLEADGQVQPVQMKFADSAGDKVTMELIQAGGGVDTFSISKVNGIGGQGITFYDNRIETNGTNGKIQTPQTVIGDNDDTLTTLKFIKDTYMPFTGGTFTGNVTINKANANFTLTGADPVLEIENVAGVDGAIEFRTVGGVRGDIRLLENFPIAPQDTLRIAKRVGGVVNNEILIQDTKTEFTQPLEVKSVTSGDSNVVLTGTGEKALTFNDTIGGDVRRGAVRYSTGQELQLTTFSTDGITILNSVDITLTKTESLNRVESATATVDTSPAQTLTRKDYVEDKTHATVSTNNLGNRNIDTSGTWRNGAGFSTGTILTGAALTTTFSTSGLNNEQLVLRNGSTRYLRYRIRFGYYLRVLVAEIYNGIGSASMQITVDSGTGPFTLNLPSLPTTAGLETMDGFYEASGIISFTQGNDISFTLPNSFGPMNTGATLPSHLAKFNGFYMRDFTFQISTI